MNQPKLEARQCPLCGRYVRIRADGLLTWHLSIARPKSGFLCTGSVKTPNEAAAIQNWRLASNKVVSGVLADLGDV